ncbi:hypothetical protein ACF07S_10325 [Streptomyces sp. NPDC016640]|uniref:hypothetical protein n=1 Tax=Streptomyces sp. NPDC016640 TaxID=3364969 RepID=UPI0036F957F5
MTRRPMSARRAREVIEPADPDGPYPEHPGWPEACSHPDGPKLQQPITNCPHWETRR